MKKFWIFLFFSSAVLNLSGQNKKDMETSIVNHPVQLGESIRLISKKYLVDPAEIYRLNKFAVEGINAGMVLKIPVPRKEEVAVQEQVPVPTSEPVHEKTQNLRDESTSIAVVENKSQTVTVIDRNSTIVHTAKPQETIYGLSRKYAISVDEIRLTNPQLKGVLKTGQLVKIPSKRALDHNETSLGSGETPSRDVLKLNSNTENTKLIQHTVAPKETLYSLSKKYSVSVEGIRRQNEALLKNGLQIGQVLTIGKNN